VLAVLAAVGLAAIGAQMPGVVARTEAAGQGAPAINADALDAMLAQLKKQQEQMVVNQTKLETQLAALKEEIRLTKIYAARSGGAGRR
jgi:hypothetical protein